jgi:cell division protein FtsN
MNSDIKDSDSMTSGTEDDDLLHDLDAFLDAFDDNEKEEKSKAEIVDDSKADSMDFDNMFLDEDDDKADFSDDLADQPLPLLDDDEDGNKQFADSPNDDTINAIVLDEDLLDPPKQSEAAEIPTRPVEIDHDELDLAGDFNLDQLDELPEESPETHEQPLIDLDELISSKSNQTEEEDIITDLLDLDALANESPQEDILPSLDDIIIPAAAAAATAAATNRVATESTSETATMSEKKAERAPLPLKTAKDAKHGVITSTLITSIIALIIGFAGVIYSIKLGNKNEELVAKIIEVEAQLAMIMQDTAIATSIHQIQNELQQIGNRVEDLTVIIANPTPPPVNEGVEQAFTEFGQRMSLIEEGLSSLEERLKTNEQLVQRLSSRVAAGANQPSNKPAPKAKTPEGWVVNIVSESSKETANRQQTRLRNLGITSQVVTANIDNKTWYRLQVTGFSTYSDAKAYVQILAERHGLKQAWVAKAK